MGYSPASTDDFNDSNIELVLSRMFHRDKIVVKKGWFPESAGGCENEKFCFVSLIQTCISQYIQACAGFIQG